MVLGYLVYRPASAVRSQGMLRPAIAVRSQGVFRQTKGEGLLQY